MYAYNDLHCNSVTPSMLQTVMLTTINSYTMSEQKFLGQLISYK